jgi:hypothetical protein
LADDQPLLLGLVRAGKKKATLLAPDLRSRRIAIHAIHQAMFRPAEEPMSQDIEHLLEEAGVAKNRLDNAQRAILKEQLGSLRVQCGWLLRYPPGVKLSSQFRHAGAIRPAITVLIMYVIQVLLSIATWYVIGRGVFQGHFDWGWLLAWGILLFATIPVQLIVNDAQSELSMRSGAVFKQRLLFGTLRLEPEEIARDGTVIRTVVESRQSNAWASGRFWHCYRCRALLGDLDLDRERWNNPRRIIGWMDSDRSSNPVALFPDQ